MDPFASVLIPCTVFVGKPFVVFNRVNFSVLMLNKFIPPREVPINKILSLYCATVSTFADEMVDESLSFGKYVFEKRIAFVSNFLSPVAVHAQIFLWLSIKIFFT